MSVLKTYFMTVLDIEDSQKCKKKGLMEESLHSLSAFYTCLVLFDSFIPLLVQHWPSSLVYMLVHVYWNLYYV